jgi:hypothetical protein
MVGPRSCPIKGFGQRPQSVCYRRISPLPSSSVIILMRPLPLASRCNMAPKKSNSKKGIAEGSHSWDPFLPVKAHGGGQGIEQLAGYVADESNE